jgi:hypothetical protein
MKEKINKILWDFAQSKLTHEEATQQVLDLFAVVGRSEQLPRSSSYEPCEGCDLSCPNWMPFFCDKK